MAGPAGGNAVAASAIDLVAHARAALSKAARAAQMGRSHLRPLCQRYGLRARLDDESG